MAQSRGGYKDENTVNEDDISTVNTEDYPSAEPTRSMSYKSSHYKEDDYSPGQSSISQQFQRLNVPPELLNAAEALDKYYPERQNNNDLKEFYNILGKRFAESDKGRYTVKVHTVTTGKTFGADEDLLSRVNCKELLLERTDQQRCDIIILFCPIISRVDLDVDAAMSEISVSAGGKPVILVLMHHTWKVDYSTPEKKWSETFENVVLNFDVLYHETERGLLECPKNQEAVNQIRRELQKYGRPVSVNTLKKYYDQHPKNPDIQRFFEDLKEEFAAALGSNTDTGDQTPPEQSTQQSLNQQNVPPELVAAANTLKKYYDQRHTNPNIQRFFEDLKEEFTPALGSNTDTGDYTSSGQSTPQSLNQQNVPADLVAAANNLKKPRNWLQILHLDRFAPALGSNTDTGSSSGSQEKKVRRKGDYTSSGQSTPQSLNQQNVPAELVAAANILKKYYDQRHTNPNIQRFFEGLKEEFAPALSSNTDTGSSSGSQEKKVRRKGGYTVKVHTVTTGETFGADEDLLRQVKNCEELLLERTDQQRCDVIILFCPIISRVDSDVDAAMSEIPVSAGGKPVILVRMHHTRKVDYSTPEKKWSETFGNVVLDVDVLYHETERGLLECPKNQEAVNQIQRELLKYSRPVWRLEKSSNQSTNSDPCCIS